MLQGHTMAIVPCGNPTPKKLPTGGGEWPTFRTARAQRTVRPLRSNSPWGFYPFQHPDLPKGQVARVSGELPPCMTRGSSLRPLSCLA